MKVIICEKLTAAETAFANDFRRLALSDDKPYDIIIWKDSDVSTTIVVRPAIASRQAENFTYHEKPGASKLRR